VPKKDDSNILADGYLSLIAEYKSYDTLEIFNPEEIDNIILHSKIPNPEVIFIKKDAYERLSPEAKEIIFIIIYSPNEILESMGFKNITKRAVRLYFSKIWNSKWIAKNTIRELTKWANQL